jgi:hypothetical protein
VLGNFEELAKASRFDELVLYGEGLESVPANVSLPPVKPTRSSKAWHIFAATAAHGAIFFAQVEQHQQAGRQRSSKCPEPTDMRQGVGRLVRVGPDMACIHSQRRSMRCPATATGKRFGKGAAFLHSALHAHLRWLLRFEHMQKPLWPLE